MNGIDFTKNSEGDYTATNGVDTIHVYKVWRRVGGYQWAANVKNGREDVTGESRHAAAKHAFRLLVQRRDTALIARNIVWSRAHGETFTPEWEAVEKAMLASGELLACINCGATATHRTDDALAGYPTCHACCPDDCTHEVPL